MADYASDEVRRELFQNAPSVPPPSTVPVGDEDLRISLSLDDQIDYLRAQQGEDPFTGIVPITEELVDVELEFPEDDDEEVVAEDVWTEEERSRLLSRAPCELIVTLFEKKYGQFWYAYEHEVLMQCLHRADLIFDAGGLNKFMALHSIMRSPEGRSSFHRSPGAFMFLAVSLSGRPTNYDDPTIPTPLEIAVAMHVVCDLRPDPYDEEVLAAVAACCFNHGIWVLPNILGQAQPYIYRLCRRMKIPVNEERVEKVKRLAAAEIADDTTIPDVPTTQDEAQALRVIDLDNRINEAIRFADEERDLLIERVE